jgi:D-glycero-alpha-D-manno-heptose-7-phosphate kinase
MIIVRTPLRVSFFGGGTDHPGWFRRYGAGAVLSTSINKYVYITLRNLPNVFDFKYRIAWRMIEQAKTADDVQHPVIREIIKNYVPQDDCGLEVSYNADLPARSGLGSSSAFTVAALHALFRHQGRPVTRKGLATEAIRVEQDFLQEPVGCQDQIAVAYGGLNRIDFLHDGDFRVIPLEIGRDRRAEFGSQLMMFFTGFTRDAGSIEKDKVENFENRKEQMNALYDTVAKGERILMDQSLPLSDLGGLLHEGWMKKRSLSAGVSSGPIDAVYDAGIAAGAYGGKLLGAGGGGFMLFLAPQDRQEAIRRALAKISFEGGGSPRYIPFALEDDGSRVVLYQPELTSNYEV